MIPFKRIYFDSNILIKEGWPNSSASLKNTLDWARLFDTETILLDVVDQELEAHWLRDYRKTESETRVRVDNLHRLAEKVGIIPEFQSPPEEKVRRAYREQVKKLVNELQLLTATSSLRSTKEFFEMAIWCVSPFKCPERGKGEGRGFQDAVILLAAIDHLAQSTLDEKTAAFVSRDGVFRADSIEGLGKAAGVRLSLYKSLDDIHSTFRKEASQAIKTWWEADRKHALNAVAQSTEVVRRFITESLEYPKDFLGGEILSVAKIDILAILNVRTPPPSERKEGEPILFATDIKIGLHSTVRENPFVEILSRSRATIKVGGEPSLDQVFGPDPLAEGLRGLPRDVVLDRTVEVEFRARMDGDKYRDLEPVSAKLK